MVGPVNAPPGFLRPQKSADISIMAAEAWWLPRPQPRRSTQQVGAFSHKGQCLLFKCG